MEEQQWIEAEADAMRQAADGRLIDVRHYGAKGDGVQDDTEAVQTILDGLDEGSTVFFPPGRYKVAGLRLFGKKHVVLCGNAHIVGDGTSGAGAVWRIERCGNVTVEGLTVSGIPTGSEDRGFWVGNSYNVTIRKNRIADFAGEAIVIWGSDDPVESTNHIYDNYLLGNGCAIRTQANGEYIHISRNKIVNNRWGIVGGLGNCRIDNNQIILNDYGVHLNSALSSNPDHSSITGNQINHNRCVGLFVENLVSGEQIADNQILSTIGGFWPVTGKPHSLVMRNVSDVAFIGNRVDADSTSDSWIHIDGHRECRYIGNTFHSGPFREISGGSGNYFIGNRYLAPSELRVHPDSTDTIRYCEQERGVFLGDAASVINKMPFGELSNGWLDAPGYGRLSYWKDGEGTIHLQGAVQGGAKGTAIGILPQHYRPRHTIDLPVSGGEGEYGAIRIQPSGEVCHLAGGNAQISISVKFKP
ncbi:glycosyl hydrolase family 28-related protein [Paenibacillus sp. GCM10027626]|uniref:glycosyl hydrolase family 28-related protein n=1 Tax=Paenibacillus sp. GCM10027626 TaxID=3273411 RepID=UPI0036371824